MLFEFLLSIFDSDCAVFVNGDGHAVLDIVEELLAKEVNCGHRIVSPDCGKNGSGSRERVYMLREEQAGVLPMTFAQ